MTNRSHRAPHSYSPLPPTFHRKPIAALLIAGLALSSTSLHAADEKTATELQGELNRANAEIRKRLAKSSSRSLLIP